MPMRPTCTLLLLASSLLLAACDSHGPIRPVEMGHYRASLSGVLEQASSGEAGFAQIDVCQLQCTPAFLNIELRDTATGARLTLVTSPSVLTDDLAKPVEIATYRQGIPSTLHVEAFFSPDTSQTDFYAATTGSMTLTQIDSSRIEGRFDIGLVPHSVYPADSSAAPTLRMVGTFSAEHDELL